MTTPSDIAIIGHACRFPGGADTPDRLWRILLEGRDVVTEIPADRWDHRHFLHPRADEPGKSYTFRAGTLGDVSGFDAAFFGISPREAAQIDPQQRLLLELTWEALERGGQVPEHLAGGDCAVYVGVSSTDYADVRQGDPGGADAYFMLGSTLSIAANRISYVFDLHGPSMAIDTACSSALVAMHEAFQAVRHGRARMAVVGAVNMLLSPFPFVGFSKASMLSAYGRCRAFDKLASGYVRAEGGGVVVLKPLADAERDGDPILAVVRGVDINADGRTHGIALPSSERQEELLRRVYRQSGADPRDLVYFEAHGTGTRAGDPVETGAIGRAVGQARGARHPLPIGSVKSNLGHLEPASGMAGLIKAIEVLRHRVIPPTLHQDEPNPDIDFQGLNIAPVTVAMPVPATRRPALVGVNSFGFGGANAHVILQEYRPAQKPPQPAESGVRPPLMLSARAPKALEQAAACLAEALSGDDPPAYYDVAWTLGTRRARHAHRLLLRSASDQALLVDLRAVASGSAPETATTGHTVSASPRVGFVYSGNGSQWLGMGVQLLDEDPVFRAEVERVDAAVRAKAGWSIIDELKAPPEASRMADTRFSQPMLFAVQLGMTRALAARGLVPEAVTGHSVGEIAAACAAGIFDLEAAVHVILCRSAVQGKTRGMGRMAAVSLGAERTQAEIEASGGAIELAAINSPSAVTLSGQESALLALKDKLAGEGADLRMLDLDYAFHNRVLEPFEAELLAALGELAPAAGTCAFYSTVSGTRLEASALDAAYWWRNIRQPVRFASAVDAMLADGVTILIEIGPHPIMQSYLRQILRAGGTSAEVLASVNRQNGAAARLDKAADRAWAAGARLAPEVLFPHAGRCVDLPTYPWQRERHWFPVTPEAWGPMYHRWEGTLLGWRPAPGATLWESQLDAQAFPFLADHQVGGAVVFPAAGFAEMALEASRQLFGGDSHDIEQMEIRRPLVLDRMKVVRLVWEAETSGFRIEARSRMQEETWSTLVTGRLAKAVHDSPPAAAVDFTPGPTARRVDAEAHYAFADSIGLVYGPAFRSVRTVTVDGGQALAELDVSLAGHGFELSPALFDGCLQALFDLVRDRITRQVAEGDRPHAYLPSQIGRLRVYGQQPAATCVIRLHKLSLRSLVASFTLRDSAGSVVAEALNCRFQRLELGNAHQPAAEYGFDVVPLVPLVAPPPVLPLPVPSSHAPCEAGLDAIAAAFCAQALAALGDRPVPEEREPLLALVALLAEGAPQQPAEVLWNAALGAHPGWLAELTVLGRVGLHLADILAGGDAAGAVPSPSTVDHFRDAAPTVKPLHEGIAAAVAQAVALWPRDRRLRVVEVGSASVGLTLRLLEALAPVDFSYTVAALDADAAARVEVELGAHPDRCAVVVDPAQPEAEAGQHDLVIAVNTLAAWGEAEAALGALTRLAAPGATVLAASLPGHAWLDLVAAAQSMAASNAALSFVAQSDQELAAAAEASGLSNVRVAGGLLAATMVAAVEPVPEPSSQPWLILAGASGEELALAETLVERLAGPALIVHSRADTADMEAITVDEAAPEAWRELFATLKEAGSEPAGLIHLLGLCATGDSADDQMGVAERRCWSTLALAQGLADAGLSRPPRLVLVSSGAVSGLALPEQAPLWGLGRVLRNEFPLLGVRQIDLNGADRAALVPALAAEIMAGDEEDEVVLGAASRHGLRLRRRKADVAAPGGEGQVLRFAAGSLDHLSWQPVGRKAPGEGEIEVEVRATGLNFRDVLLALGALPDEAVENGFAGATVGMEAAGIVTRVGPGVSEFRPGDAVLTFAPACFASHITVRTVAVARKPDEISFAEAATIPTAFFTVYYALGDLARLRRGERVLIHGAAGGVGLAAIQYARHVGAEIFATAGTPEKRDLVRLAGVPESHILDSRSLAFADQVMALTGDEGVDVVLNSLAGEAIHKSLLTLRPFGRFIELGKRDFFANTPLGLRPFRNNISYFGVDADQLMAVRPDLAGRLFGEMMALFRQGVFRPLPYRLFGRGRVVEAFRHMQQSRHTGKIIVSGSDAVPAQPAASETLPEFSLDPQASYLVTGGLGGFGLETARWLAARGARHLVLASRRGAQGEDARRAVAELEAMGVEVTAVACDVTDEAQVAALVAETHTAHPLKGVVHAAAVFDDAIAANLARDQFRRVLAPKVSGAWALHRATNGLALDFFVLYSSVTTILGNPGQSNYVAANLYLEALARHRRALGLPALAVGWSAIADAGYLTRNVEVKESLTGRMGVAALDAQGALDRLAALLARPGQPVTVIADLNWQALGGILPALKSPSFGEVRVSVGGGEGRDSRDLAALLENLSPAEVREVLVEMVAEQVGRVLRIPPDRLALDASIFDLGMDSLMALELRMAIEDQFGVELPAMAISEGASITRLAERLRDHLVGAAPVPQGDVVDQLLAQHGESLDNEALAARLGASPADAL